MARQSCASQSAECAPQGAARGRESDGSQEGRQAGPGYRDSARAGSAAEAPRRHGGHAVCERASARRALGRGAFAGRHLRSFPGHGDRAGERALRLRQRRSRLDERDRGDAGRQVDPGLHRRDPRTAGGDAAELLDRPRHLQRDEPARLLPGARGDLPGLPDAPPCERPADQAGQQAVVRPQDGALPARSLRPRDLPQQQVRQPGRLQRRVRRLRPPAPAERTSRAAQHDQRRYPRDARDAALVARHVAGLRGHARVDPVQGAGLAQVHDQRRAGVRAAVSALRQRARRRLQGDPLGPAQAQDEVRAGQAGRAAVPGQGGPDPGVRDARRAWATARAPRRVGASLDHARHQVGRAAAADRPRARRQDALCLAGVPDRADLLQQGRARAARRAGGAATRTSGAIRTRGSCSSSARTTCSSTS